MYLETMEQVLGGVDKVIIDKGVGGNGVVPYLPLEPLNDNTPPPPAVDTHAASGRHATTAGTHHDHLYGHRG